MRMYLSTPWIMVAEFFFSQGLIDDARIYNRALSASEVYVLHELSNPTTPGGMLPC